MFITQYMLYVFSITYLCLSHLLQVNWMHYILFFMQKLGQLGQVPHISKAEMILMSDIVCKPKCFSASLCTYAHLSQMLLYFS